MAKEEEFGFDYAFGFTRWAMKLVGLWPINDESSYVKTIVMLGSVTVSLIPSTARMIVRTDYPSTLKQVFLTFPLFVALINLTMIKVMNNVLRDILRAMHEDWERYASLTRSGKTTMVLFAQSGRRANIVCIITTLLSIIAYLTEPFRSRTLNEKSTNETIRKLPSEGLYPFDITESPAYEIMYAVQTVTSCLYGTIVFSLHCLLIVTVCHASGQLCVVGVALERYVGNVVHGQTCDVNKCNCACIKCIVESHIRALTFTNNVKLLFWKFMLLQQLGSILILAVEGYELITYAKENDAVGVLVYAVYAISATYGLFICCYSGQRIIDQSESLGSIAYHLEWHALPRKSTLPLILLTIRSQRPCELTTKFAVMSLSYYRKVLTTSVSYISVLMAIK